jgi:hypothetical protein
MSDNPAARSVTCPNCETVYKIPTGVTAPTARCRVCKTSFSLEKQVGQGKARKAPKQSPKPLVQESAIQPSPVRQRKNAANPPLSLGEDAFLDNSNAAIPSVKKSSIAIILWQCVRLPFLVLWIPLKLAWLAIRQTYRLGTGPNRNVHIPWISACAVLVLIGVAVGIFRIKTLFDSPAPLARAAEKEAVPKQEKVPVQDEKDHIVEPKQIAVPEEKEPLLEQKKNPAPQEKEPPPKVKKNPVPEEKGPIFELKKVYLIVRHEENQKYDVKFDAIAKLTTRDRKGQQEHVFAARHVSRFQEMTEKIDPIKEYVFRRMEYKECTIDFELDGEKGAKIMRNQEEIQEHLPALAWTQKLNRDNRQLDSDRDLKNIPAGLRREVDGFHHGHLDELHQMVWVRMPEKDPDNDFTLVAPGDTWSDSSNTEMAIAGGAGKGDLRSIERTYTYLGVQKLEGREEAIIRVKTKLRETRDKEVRLKADGEGKAYLDLEAKEISRVEIELKLEFDTDVFVIDGKSNGSGTLNLKLKRDLFGNP